METIANAVLLPRLIRKTACDAQPSYGIRSIQAPSGVRSRPPANTTICMSENKTNWLTYVATASFSRGNGEEAVSVATGIGVLANNGSSGIYTHRYGTDGVEWRRDRNVKRYRR